MYVGGLLPWTSGLLKIFLLKFLSQIKEHLLIYFRAISTIVSVMITEMFLRWAFWKTSWNKPQKFSLWVIISSKTSSEKSKSELWGPTKFNYKSLGPKIQEIVIKFSSGKFRSQLWGPTKLLFKFLEPKIKEILLKTSSKNPN